MTCGTFWQFTQLRTNGNAQTVSFLWTFSLNSQVESIDLFISLQIQMCSGSLIGVSVLRFHAASLCVGQNKFSFLLKTELQGRLDIIG